MEMSKDSSWFSQFRDGSNPWMARYVYGLMFLVSNLLAWFVRDNGQGILSHVERTKNCEDVQDCLGTEDVLRVSFGCFAFFLIMFLTTVSTKKLPDPRDSWHSGWWSAKSIICIALTIFPFTLPSSFLRFYGLVALFGAGAFLLIQLVSIICFIKWLNDFCQADDKAERCHIHMMLLATTAYVISVVGIIMMYICKTEEAILILRLQVILHITWTLVLLQLMTSVSLHPKVNAGILTPGLMGLYVVFICWCAIRSEPEGQHCIRKAGDSNKTDWLTIISFIVALLAMVIATFSTGIDSQCFQIRKDDDAPAEDDVPYGYGFFHFVFATGAMYFAMLLIGWNTNDHTIQRWSIDVGWTSTWVRIVNEWLAVCVYIWMLVAPIILKSRQTGFFQDIP